MYLSNDLTVMILFIQLKKGNKSYIQLWFSNILMQCYACYYPKLINCMMVFNPFHPLNAKLIFVWA